MMVEDECMAADMMVAEDGESISDSGATAPVVGDKRWARFLAEKAARGNTNPITYHRCHRKFKFGAGAVLTATRYARFVGYVLGKPQEIVIYLFPGETPMLTSQKDLERWGIIIDFRNKRVTSADDKSKTWYSMRQSQAKGHLSFGRSAPAKGRHESTTTTDD